MLLDTHSTDDVGAEPSPADVAILRKLKSVGKSRERLESLG